MYLIDTEVAVMSPPPAAARAPLARSGAWVSGVVAVTLVALASRYGYHRDELYFLAAGRHLDWSYPDQGPLTPLLARVMNAIDPGSLTLLRLPSALAAAATVLLTGMLARELGGRARAQSLAAVTAAVAVIVLFTGHTLSTSTFDLLAWTLLSWLVVHAIRARRDRLWLVIGAVFGVALLNKPLPVFFAVALLAGIAVAGPRRLLHNRYLWAGAAIAVALWSPWLIWQTAHGWPQLTVSRAIAGGGSTSSQPWWAVVPFQALLAGPVLAPVWIAGLVRLFRDPALRNVRFLAWTWLFLAIAFMATGGKPYYLAGLLPVLIGSGSVWVDAWLDRGRARAGRVLLSAVVAISALAGLLIALPVLPADHAGPVVAMNPDVGETIGWPQLARTVANVAGRLPAGARPVVVTANYGEAGAIDRFGPALGLPQAYSGHNAYSHWGPPPDGSAPVIAIGFDPDKLATHMRGCTIATHVTNSAGVDNDENGAAVAVCDAPLRPWSLVWPSLTHLD
jgi:Dolichyl-phosphate-mannose-protein mannosyltransferase